MTCVLGLGALLFAWELIRAGDDPNTTIALTLALVTGIVTAVASAGAVRSSRLSEAVRVFLNGEGPRR
ncbi:hypothetical protein OHB26_39600 (plasmid) [Nocardia sp. NBC_01503]|uniref:hypothetical protein n=1 Tax=Nocardia sp. NBC_01503 TaxID=2975997 RepID=UPI002E7AE418|nr:hypothetical protein [Nocardia sp. NBC_01503]WTL36663.1 hypothetical protein OHB26_38975 [Nocardia sp. NBC_01503]WTL36784.1 hypothetical protein OHB26_39600 [Nocardia sp. NBC_01503]